MAEAYTSQEGQEETGRRQIKILINDDDLALSGDWVCILADRGHAVTVTDTVPAAMYAAMTDSFDLVLTELFVGGAATVPFCYYVAYAQPITPVVMVTGSTPFTGGEAQRLAANIELVLRKPVPRQDLAATADYMAQQMPGLRLVLTDGAAAPDFCRHPTL